MPNYTEYFPGDLVQLIEAKDQSLYYRKQFVGKYGIIIRKCTQQEDGVVSSPNMYRVYVESRILNLHCLDLKLLSRVK